MAESLDFSGEFLLSVGRLFLAVSEYFYFMGCLSVFFIGAVCGYSVLILIGILTRNHWVFCAAWQVLRGFPRVFVKVG